jgi:hypothetical protein
MQKKYLFLGIFLLATTLMISGCGAKKENQQVANNAVNDQAPTTNQTTDQNQAQEQAQINDQTAETINPSGQYSINELFAMNKPMKCTWKDSVAKGDVTNTIYLNGKNFYQDVTMGDIGHSYMIYNGDYLYIWNSFNDIASKMKNTEATTGTEPKKDSAGLDQKKDFICEGWAADNSVFTPPANKNFKDITDEMNEAVQDLNNSGAERLNKQVCDQCKKAPTQELRDKCMEGIECD